MFSCTSCFFSAVAASHQLHNKFCPSLLVKSFVCPQRHRWRTRIFNQIVNNSCRGFRGSLVLQDKQGCFRTQAASLSLYLDRLYLSCLMYRYKYVTLHIVWCTEDWGRLCLFILRWNLCNLKRSYSYMLQWKKKSWCVHLLIWAGPLAFLNLFLIYVWSSKQAWPAAGGHCFKPLGGTWLRKRTRQEAKKHGGAEPDEMGSFHYSFFRFFLRRLTEAPEQGRAPKGFGVSLCWQYLAVDMVNQHLASVMTEHNPINWNCIQMSHRYSGWLVQIWDSNLLWAWLHVHVKEYCRFVNLFVDAGFARYLIGAMAKILRYCLSVS